ncbi:MAG: ABC transporter substrate-binding protein [Anaerolineae bacterium]
MRITLVSRARHPLWGLLARIAIGIALSSAVLSCTSAMPPLPVTPHAGQNRLRVAILTPLSEELATYGRTVRRAIELAFDEWNERRSGGVFIESVSEDTPCDAMLARQVAERLITTGVRFIIGGICSEAAIPIASVADKNGALFIATSATHPLVTVDAQGNTRSLVFRTAFTYAQQGRAVSRFLLRTLHLSRIAVVNNPRSPFAREVVAAFDEAFATQGGIALIITADPNQPADFSEYFDMPVIPNAQAIYVPGDYTTVMHVRDMLRQRGMDKPVLGSDWWNTHNLDLAAMEGVYLVAHYSDQNADPTAQQWAARYRAAFAVESDALAALAYDAAMLLARGIDQSKSILPEAVASALRTVDYEGVTGHWHFNAQHNPLKQAVFLRVQNGTLQFAGSASVE